MITVGWGQGLEHDNSALVLPKNENFVLRVYVLADEMLRKLRFIA